MMINKISLLLFKEIINNQTDVKIDSKNRIVFNGLFLGQLKVKLCKEEK